MSENVNQAFESPGRKALDRLTCRKIKSIYNERLQICFYSKRKRDISLEGTKNEDEV